MRTTRRTVLAGGAGIAALGLGACGTGGTSGGSDAAGAAEGEVAGEITFQSWSLKNETFTPYFEALLEAFHAEHPEATVTWVDQPGDGYQDKVLAQANSDSLPDVVNLPPDMAFPLAQGGLLMDLAAADPELSEVYVEGGVGAYQFPEVEGSYGYPWYLGTDMNYWNLAELEKYGVAESSLPTSIEELLELARTAHEADAPNPVISSMPEIIVTGDATSFTFNTPENVALLQSYADLYAEGALPAEVLNNDYAGNSTLYTQNKVMWTTSTSSFARELQNNAPTLVEDTRATARFGTPPLFVQGISIPASTANSPTAIAFAKFLTSTENQIAFVKLAQGFLPGTKEAAADPTLYAAETDVALEIEANEVAASSMESAEDQTNVLWTEDMRTNMTQQVARAMQGEITPQEALDAAVQYGNDNLQ